MKFKLPLALLLLSLLSPVAHADLCISATTGGWVTCSTSATGPLAAPGPIGSGTPSSGAFTTLSASGAVSGAGFSSYLASPPAIGGSAPAAGTFTTLGATGLFSPQLGITATGAAINLNASSNFNTSIGTGTTTGTVSIGNTAGTGSAITLAAPVTLGLGTSLSAANWGTAGIGLVVPAATFNDTTVGSGTVADDAAYGIAAPTFTNTQGTANTLTSATTLFVTAPLCTTGANNWSACTSKYAIKSNGNIFTTGLVQAQGGLTITGAAVSINAASNFTIGIGSTSNTQAISIGNSANLVNLGPTEINAGTKFTLGNFSGCSTTNGTPTTLTGGPQGGSFVTASSGTTCSVVITINGATGKTAANGWACWGSDITSAVALAQSASSTTTCTLKGTINATSDTVIFMAMGY